MIVPPSIASGSGDTLTVRPPGATASGSLRSRFGVILDAVNDFGATGDGVADDTAAFEAAIAALKALGGGVLVIPRGTYALTRPLILPSRVTLRGVGRASVLTRPTSTITTLAANGGAGQRTATVLSAAGLAEGMAVSVWDDVCGNDNIPTWGLIESIAGNVVTLDRPFFNNYNTNRNAKLGTLFSLVRNEPFSEDVCLEALALDHNAADTDPAFMFPMSVVEWVLAFGHRIEGCWLLNSIADGYSDQANDYTNVIPVDDYLTFNTLDDCTVDSPGRHCIHLGTIMHGGSVTRNRLLNAGRRDANGAVIFYCAFVTRTDFSHNYGYNAASEAVQGMDFRDVENRLTHNTFEKCGRGISLGDSQYNLVQGNHILETAGSPAIQANGASDCEILDNVIVSTSPHQSTIAVSNSTRMTVQGNNLTGETTGANGFDFNGTTDSKLLNNTAHGHYHSLTIDDCQRLDVAGNSFLAPSTGNAVDITTGASCTDLTFSRNTVDGTFTWDARPPRLLLNGLGDNGTDDPASAGDWHGVSGPARSGTLVRYSSGGDKVKLFHDAAGWIPLN